MTLAIVRSYSSVFCLCQLKSPKLWLDSSLPLTEVNFKDKSGCIIKVLDYLQKMKTLKMTFFLDQSFGIGLK